VSVPEELFVSVVVPTFRNPEPLCETLASLRSLDYPPERYEIIVVDDCTDRDTAAVVKNAGAEPPVVRYVAQANRGAGSARNHGARLATGEVLIFVDDDMLVPPELIRSHLKALDTHAPAVVSGYREFAPELSWRLRATPFGRFRLVSESRQEWGDEHRTALETCDYFRPHPEGLPANDLAIRRADFFSIGGFDEEFPHAGYEDQEFTLRATNEGYVCLVNHGLRAWHNDRRLTLRQFGERQRRGATTAVLLASKYPQRYRGRPLFTENAPVRREDAARLKAKKLAKATLATGVGMGSLFAAIAVLERATPHSRALQRAYRVVTGVYTFAGVREGLSRYQPWDASEPAPVVSATA
jgi:GT2 family glycosyltransferase